MRQRRVTLVGLLMGALLLAWTPSAEAATFKTRDKWRNCDTFKSAISVRVTFTDPARSYGNGKYMVKRWVEWEYWKGGKWKEADRHYTESTWQKITNPAYDWVTTPGDRTGWHGLYREHWRAKVTVKLIKNRPGPRDKKVEELQIYPTKGSFREIGSNCGYEF